MEENDTTLWRLKYFIEATGNGVTTTNAYFGARGVGMLFCRPKASLLRADRIIGLIKEFNNDLKIDHIALRDVSAGYDIKSYEKKNFITRYFDIFPIHHYKNLKRKIFNRSSYRPISSPYFEKIMYKNKLKK